LFHTLIAEKDERVGLLLLLKLNCLYNLKRWPLLSFIHVFIYSVIVVQLTTDNDRSKRSEVEVE